MNWVLAFWGTVMAGGIAVAVNTRSARPEVEFVLTDAGVRVDLTADAALPDGDSYVEEGLGANDVAALFYTYATCLSAARYWLGRGGRWKGRSQATDP